MSSSSPPDLRRFQAGHEDLIHDIAYDFYGKRLIAHDCSVIKVSWAHPEFGHVFASGSFDRTVKIWEEMEHESKGGGRRWKLVATLSDARGSIHDVEFAPNHLGLKIATASSDGFVRIYEAIDVVNLSSWTLMSEFEISPSNPARESTHPTLSWCPSRFHPQTLCVGLNLDAKLFRVDSNNNSWTHVQSLGGHGGMVTDVAWGPNLGREYELVATGCKDGVVRIFKLVVDEGKGGAGRKSGGGSRWKVDLVAAFDEHKAEVWKVEWNVLGNVLSSSGDDGKVRLWSATYLDDWKCKSVISTEDAPQEDAMMIR
ncbi:epoxide hydrolase, soluble (sEH) [Chytridiales sp. JEL 0842]|nr:epoxide hydrolase, soluble (sEH) [Chytridiales sp. JEL 0842]